MFDIQKKALTLAAPRHLRLALLSGALALAPGMLPALELDLGIAGVRIGGGGVGVNVLGDRGVNADVNTRDGVGANVSVGGSGGVNADVGVGGQGIGVGASVGGSGGVGASVGIGSGNGGGSNPGGSNPGGSDPGGSDPGTGTDPGNGSSGNDNGSGPGNGIVISEVGLLPQARLALPVSCAPAGNYDLLIGVPVLTAASQMIGAVAGAYVEGGMLTRLRVAVDPAYAPPGGCVEIANLAGSRAGAEGLLLDVSLAAIRGALH